MDDPSIAERPVDPAATSPGRTPPAPAGPPAPAMPPTPATPPAVRAQLLATEHWGLLASRSTTQAEVLTRIAIFLTMVSAGLVSIGLLGQVTRFADWFPVAALCVLAFLSLVGLMTQVRVHNASEEDLMYVVAMNRLRGAYADLDPGVEQYFLASVDDDEGGMARTYSFMRKRTVSHGIGSSGLLITVVTALMLGMLAGGIVAVAGGSYGQAIAVGCLVGLANVAGMTAYGMWAYAVAWRHHVPLRGAVHGARAHPFFPDHTRRHPPA